MEKEFWHEKWESNEIGFHQDEAHPLLVNHFSTLEVPADGRVFVPLCGKSRDMLCLRDMGYKVTGLELSELAVKSFFSENDLEFDISQGEDFRNYMANGLQVLCGDFFKLTTRALENVDAVFDRASLVAMPPGMRPGYVNVFRSLLVSGCRILLVVLEYEDGLIKPPPFAIHQEEIMHLYASWCRVEQIAKIDSEVKGQPCREVAYLLTVN